MPIKREDLVRRATIVEEKPRTIKVPEALSKMTEPGSPADIGIIIEVSPPDTGKIL